MNTGVQLTKNQSDRPEVSPFLRLVPTWKGNLFVFGFLIVMVLVYFYWQVQQAHRVFLYRVRQNSKMIADVIRLNAKGAVLSQNVVEEIIQTFLGNTARFVDYLDDVEPFSPEELAAFTAEAGLAGIRVVREGAEYTDGPPGWFSAENAVCRPEAPHLQHLSASHLYTLAWPREKTTGCIIVGITAGRIEKLQDQIGLPHLLTTLTALAGIEYVRIETDNPVAPDPSSHPEVTLIEAPGSKIAETRLSVGKDILVVGLDARHFFERVKQLRYEFIIFSAILAFFGVFFSWLLYRFQAAYLKQVQNFERRFARQREDAVLGQSAASIAHEIGNPLNAISMGLQRLQIEADEMTEEHRNLVSGMLTAVKRTKGIITNIRRYAKPLVPRNQPVRLDTIVATILTLYTEQCKARRIETTCEIKYSSPVTGDPEMFEEVVENLIKNAIEAQPDGGYLRVTLERVGSDAVLVIENSGYTNSETEPERIMEPYYTTKTRGTGLGLSIANRIIRSHEGRLAVEVPSAGILRVAVYVPIRECHENSCC
ncbi:MAG: ATP-binding protein [Pseudomonadota bacterium]